MHTSVHACRYIHHSLKDDLASITHLYSESGYGPGSRFWVAELPSADCDCDCGCNCGDDVATCPFSSLLDTHQHRGSCGTHDATLGGPGGTGSRSLPRSSSSSCSSRHSSSVCFEGGSCVVVGTAAAAAAVRENGDRSSSTGCGGSGSRHRHMVVVGTVALQRMSGDHAELRRMSVAKEARGAQAPSWERVLSRVEVGDFRQQLYPAATVLLGKCACTVRQLDARSGSLKMVYIPADASI
jgi:hypothetical protein